jgi:hypothetical protein
MQPKVVPSDGEKAFCASLYGSVVLASTDGGSALRQIIREKFGDVLDSVDRAERHLRLVRCLDEYRDPTTGQGVLQAFLRGEVSHQWLVPFFFFLFQ